MALVVEHHLAEETVELFLQAADTALAGVVLNQVLQRGFVQADALVVLQAAALLDARHQMALGYLNLLLGDIAVDFDELHTVEQRTGDRADGVGRSNKHDVRQINIHLEEVVVEGFVLLGVEHFQQGAGGVAVVSILGNLVDLVEHKHGIARISLDEAFDDTAWHRANVGAAVTADLGFVMQAAQRSTHILAVHRIGDTAAERSLAHTRRTVEAEDGGAGCIVTEIAHGNVFQDALLDLLHPVVVLFQNLLSTREVVVAFCALVPRQLHEGLEIGELYLIVGALRVHAFQLVELVAERGLDVLRPLQVLSLAAQLGYITACGVAELLLDVLELALEEVVALLLVEIHLRLLAYIAADAGVLNLARNLAQQLRAAHDGILLAQQIHLDVCIDGEVCTHEVDEEAHAGCVVQRCQCLAAELLVEACVFGQLSIEGLAHELVGLAVHLIIELGARSNGCHQCAVGSKAVEDVNGCKALNDGRRGVVGQFVDTDDASHNTDVVEVGGLWLFNLGSFLRSTKDIGGILEGLLADAYGGDSADRHWQNDAREEHNVPQGQHR